MEIIGTTTKEDVREYFKIISSGKASGKKRPPIGIMLIVSVTIGILVYFGKNSKKLSSFVLLLNTIFVLCVVLFGLALFVLLLRVIGIRSLEASLKKEQDAAGRPLSFYIWLTEEGITSARDDNAQKNFFSWFIVEKLIITPNLYLFVTNTNTFVFFNKKWVEGREPLLMQMVAYSMPGKPVIQCR